MLILNYVCGGLVPVEVANTVRQIYNVLLVAVPVIIVVLGIIDFVKAVASGKDDDISKNTRIFVKRLITGVIVFFVLALVKLAVNLIKTNNTSEAVECLNEFFGS